MLAIYWMNYEYFKKFFISKITENNKLLEGMEHFAVSFGSGALSGMLAAAITTPFDVIKTRRQVALHSKCFQHEVY
jgi:solute carrier family 25 protein 39/40